MFLRVFHPESLLQLFCSCHDILDSDAVHGEESLVRSRLSELILDTDPLNNAFAFFGCDFADSAAEAVDNVMVFDRDDLADLVDAVLDGDDVEEKARAFMEILEP